MVQKATSQPKRLGRRPEFDRDAVVSAAVSTFWAKGFEATTLSDLEEATGVDRSTIYNSFGGKTGLYRSATTAYVDRSIVVLFEPLSQGTAGVDDIIRFLDRLAGVLGSNTNPPGCLIVNDMAADIDHESTNRYLDYLQTGFRLALDRGSALGEIDPNQSTQRARTLTAAVLGVNIIHRNRSNAPTAPDLIDSLRDEVRSWRVPRTDRCGLGAAEP